MSDQRKKPGWTFWITVAVLVMLIVYATAYLMLAKAMMDGVRIVPYYTTTSKTFNAALTALFKPAHSVDIYLRRERWHREPCQW